PRPKRPEKSRARSRLSPSEPGVRTALRDGLGRKRPRLFRQGFTVAQAFNDRSDLSCTEIDLRSVMAWLVFAVKTALPIGFDLNDTSGAARGGVEAPAGESC